MLCPCCQEHAISFKEFFDGRMFQAKCRHCGRWLRSTRAGILYLLACVTAAAAAFLFIFLLVGLTLDEPDLKQGQFPEPPSWLGTIAPIAASLICLPGGAGLIWLVWRYESYRLVPEKGKFGEGSSRRS